MTDLLALALSAVRAHKLRSFLSTLGIAIGVGSVVLLTSIGEGTRQFMIDQFTQFGTNIIAVHPGKAQTIGIPGMLGGTTNPLTLEDALAIDRLPQVDKAVPMAMASARVEAGELGRSVFVFGVTAEVPAVFKFDVRQGSFWPESDARPGRTGGGRHRAHREARAVRRGERAGPLRAHRRDAFPGDRHPRIEGPDDRPRHRRRRLHSDRYRDEDLQPRGGLRDRRRSSPPTRRSRSRRRSAR